MQITILQIVQAVQYKCQVLNCVRLSDILNFLKKGIKA